MVGTGRFERPALIVMDFAGEARTLAALIRQTARDADLVFAAGHSPLLGALATAGFVKIPLRFNPRPLHHLVLDFTGHPIVYDAAVWELSLGDWGSVQDVMMWVYAVNERLKSQMK